MSNRKTLAWIGTITLILSCSGCLVAAVGGAGTAIMVAHDRRTTGNWIDDQSLDWKVEHQLDRIRGLQPAHYNVTCYNGIVLITGQVATEMIKQQVSLAMGKLQVVKKFFNQLELGKNTSISTRIHDSWLSTKVTSAISTTKHVDPTSILVRTENSKVYLMGLVTHQEAELATAKARTVSGVKEVVKLFEYHDQF